MIKGFDFIFFVLSRKTYFLHIFIYLHIKDLKLIRFILCSIHRVTNKNIILSCLHKIQCPIVKLLRCQILQSFAGPLYQQ